MRLARVMQYGVLMAKGTSKSKVLKNAQKVAAATTMDSVARNAGKYDANNQAKKADSQATASGPQHSKKPEKKMSTARKALVVFAAAMVVVLGCCCVAFAAVEESRSHFVPENTMLDGQIDVSGMTEDELRALLTRRVESGIATTVTLTAGDTSHSIEMGDIGTIDIDATVEQAFAPYRANPVVRAFVSVGKLMGIGPDGYDICTVCVVDHDALATRVAAIAEKANMPAKNAGYAYDKGTNALVIAPAMQGVKMDEAATITRIEQALAAVDNGDPERLSIQAEAIITEPESNDPGQGIFVDTRKCRVHLYENGVEVASYPCTPGMSGYATPKGDFTLSYKDPAPIWYNPHSDWSEGMEETIAPGPSNPLGVRALAVSCGGGIFLHGTTNTGGLGSPGSHGCVRLSNSNIVELYDRVSVGIPIIIR